MKKGRDIGVDDVPVPERAKMKHMKKGGKRGRRRGRHSSRY